MTGHEHEAKKIVAHFVVERALDLCDGSVLLHLQLAAELFVLALDERSPR